MNSFEYINLSNGQAIIDSCEGYYRHPETYSTSVRVNSDISLEPVKSVRRDGRNRFVTMEDGREFRIIPREHDPKVKKYASL